MIVVMKPDATEDQISHVRDHISQLGLQPQVIVGRHQTVIAAIGEERPGLVETLEPSPGVVKVLPIMAPYKRASSELKAERTVVRARSLEIGGKRIGVIAGPCSVESEGQIVSIARTLKALGATGLRGGAYKPRTSPYSFQGHKVDGLKMLATARDETGLAIVTEVMAPEHVAVVAEYADVLQIGARNMQNYQLLTAVGESGKPAFLKRGMASTMEEFLLAAEYILDRGNDQVILCERGVRTFEEHTRFTLPLASVPYLQAKTHLPVVVDPSHGTGKAPLVPPMARAAIAAGADGLMVEVHEDPEHAMSDGAQTITPSAFERMMAECRRVAEAVDRSL
ncbi:3-deoxy-7-phosphoheptulonate synthase [Tautonia plasticadhaerens]|uniref:Phospho-2-dehydro-3-deoxyheptonate aldolase n=1 Tax=Tautonia plasticadhaerens TaxID=2527974 RepID=A0A518H0H1_9BACT|nr:3-deoxy-7-phosphoheptulonate synthase [Tautonia plasticadhaerens]QDV34328.1 Phospho-2-dehydro-3-deoxyheptonate aldolase [Tautonia plasticadhaerens]